MLIQRLHSFWVDLENHLTHPMLFITCHLSANPGFSRALILFGHLFFSYPATLLPLRCVVTLEAEIKKVDQQYDLCNDTWAKGEADKFASEEFLDLMSHFNAC